MIAAKQPQPQCHLNNATAFCSKIFNAGNNVLPYLQNSANFFVILQLLILAYLLMLLKLSIIIAVKDHESASQQTNAQYTF